MKHFTDRVSKLLCFTFILFISQNALCQNKTLGVGTVSPNPNAALHVESPGSNQGFILPRLTTAQRSATGFKSILTSTDNGLMVYDNDLKQIFIWTDTAWFGIAHGQDINVVNAVGSSFALNDPASTNAALSVSTNGTSAALNVSNAGTGSSAHGAYIQSEATSSGAAVFASQLGMGRAGQFQITNPLNNDVAVRGFTSGTSNAGYFTINNPANSFPVIYATTNGTGAGITAENAGAGNGFAGLFRTLNVANTYPALQAETKGPGPGLTVIQSTGTGPGVNVFLQNTSSNANGYFVNQQGLGNGGYFLVSNTSSGAAAVLAQSSSTTGGRALQVDQNGGGIAIDIQNGTLKHSTSLVNFAGGPITARAGVIEIGSGGVTQIFTLGWATVSGETCIIFNNAGGSVTVEGQLLSNQQLAQFIYIGGAWRKI
jgi:hypothetical protein